jgi:hypothetical protein
MALGGTPVAALDLTIPETYGNPFGVQMFPAKSRFLVGGQRVIIWQLKRISSGELLKRTVLVVYAEWLRKTATMLLLTALNRER